MIHSFDIDIAKEFGVTQAILLNHLWFWIAKNEANDKHFNDGYYWTYSSIKAFGLLFPYLSERKIYNALHDLEDIGILVTGNYNKLNYDKTKWYTFTQLGKSLMQKCKIDDVKMYNRNDQSAEPIPYNNTDNKTDIDVFFEQCWTLYPKKQGKGQIQPKRKKIAYELGEEFKRCIERYKQDKKDTPAEYLQHGSTFWNGGYVDYLDANYVKTDNDIKERLKILLRKYPRYSDIPEAERQGITLEQWNDYRKG